MSFNIFPECVRALLPGYAVHMIALAVSVSLMSARTVGAQEVQGGCGPIRSGGFIYDYRPDKFVPDGTYRSVYDMRKIVEDAHFTPQVETLQRGQSSTRPGPDISYALERIPNHHRALVAMVALGEKEKTSQPFGSKYSVECWFRRAIAWRADDNTVRMLYAQYLFKVMREKEAEQQLGVASSQADDNPFTQHNIGLVFFEARDYDKALFHAHKAYALGLVNPMLRDQLKSVGKWSEPAEASPEEATKSPP